MAFYFQKISDEGTSNPIVARTFIQWSELMQPCRLHKDQKIDKDKKADLGAVFLGIQKAILAAHKEAAPLVEELRAIDSDPVAHGLIWEPHKRAIPSALKLDNLGAFLKYAHECLRWLAQALSIFFDQGWNEAKFEPILEYAKKEQERIQEDWLLVELLQRDLAWLEDMRELRNVEDHKLYKREKKGSFFVNYTLSEKGELVRPKLYDGRDVLAFLADAVERLFLFSELLIVSAIEIYLPEPIAIAEIPVEKRRKECPKRFKLGLGYFSVPPRDYLPTT